MKQPRQRSLEEAISEVERELAVRSRCFNRWVSEGKLSSVEAEDRRDRLMTALEHLQELSSKSPDPGAVVGMSPPTEASSSQEQGLQPPF